MRKIILPIAFIATFCLGFTAAHFSSADTPFPVGHVTGVGGIFFKAENPDSLKKWYTKNLGMPTDQYGTNFVWYQGADSTKHGSTQWSLFGSKTKYFNPSKKEFMINYRVDNIEVMMKRFRENGVTICDTVASYDYGKFVHIMDPEGNKIELWEPNDEVYDKYLGATVK